MSEDAVHKLVRKAYADPQLTKRLEDALAREDDAVSSFLAVAAEQGCAFTADEFVKVMESDGADERPRQLAESELNVVTGGGRTFATNAVRLFKTFRAGPSAKQIGPGTGDFA